MPIRRAVLMIRQAISPRLAIRMRLNMQRALPREPSGPQGLRRQRQKVNRKDLLGVPLRPQRRSHPPAAAALAAPMRVDPFEDFDVDIVEVAAALRPPGARPTPEGSAIH